MQQDGGVSDTQHEADGNGGILPSVRIGTPEREAAVSALDAHWHEGRLDPAEHERRTTAARAARTRAELDALFADLPDRAAPRGAAPDHHASLDRMPPPRVPEPGSGPLLGGLVGRHRDTVMALTPFVAVGLFFLFGYSWLWFLLIPVMGILLFGADDRGRRHRRDDGNRRGC
jgi:hypothetical protein